MDLSDQLQQNAASTASGQGACPKTRPIGHTSGYGQFRLTLESHLRCQNAVTLAHWFGYGKAEIDNISRSDNPSRTFVQCMHNRGEICPTDISKLIEALENKAVGLGSIAVKFKEAFKLCTPTSHSTSVINGYGQFRLILESHLTHQNAVTLALWFGYGNAEIDNISRSDNPSRAFVQFMDDRGEICPTDISKLIEALENKAVGLGGIAVEVKEAFKLCTPTNHSSSVTNDKKTQFVTELKKRYKKLSGEIQPAPFLRDKYDISDLFVGSGMKFLIRNKQGEEWIELQDYKKIFTDPQISSTRRIIDGGPGFGKSTLALQITHDWCQKLPPINKFEILILLHLRQFRNVSDIYIAIKKFLLPADSKLTVEDIMCILDSSTTVILFDGYDDYPHRGNRNTQVECIIRGDMCQKHDVVLMTRTSCLPQDFSIYTKRISLTGFNDAVRQKYIKKVLEKDGATQAAEINQFFKDNAVLEDLSTVPQLFVMISHMAEKMGTLRDLKTVTKFFARIVACIHSHGKGKVETATNQSRDKRDHSELDRAAFEALKTDSPKITWDKEDLRGKIGDDLYEECVSTGILIENEVLNDETSGLKTETKFFHKIFAEWYAAHYLAQEAAKPETGFQPWPRSKMRAPYTLGNRPSDRSNVHTLSNLNPEDVHYTYRFACGLNQDAALKIVPHLGMAESLAWCTLLCMKEYDGSMETFKGTIDFLCSESIRFDENSILQKSLVELLKFASSRKVPIQSVFLHNCLDLDASAPGNVCLKPSNLFLPVITTTLKRIAILQNGLVISAEELENILQYASKCLGLESLEFYFCLLYNAKVTESVRVLQSRNVEVLWVTGEAFVLNLESGIWEDKKNGEPMTQEQNLKAVMAAMKLREVLQEESSQNKRVLAQATHSYTLQNDHLVDGDITEITSQQDPLLKEGAANGKQGHFPSHCVVTGPENGEKRKHQDYATPDIRDKTILSAEATVSNDGGLLQIENTDIKLIIPPKALGTSNAQCLVRMRVIPPGSHSAVTTSFSSHSSTVLELLPNNLRFQQPVELTLPHCLKLKKDAEYKAKIFMSHHEGDVEPRWEEVTDHHYILRDKSCTLWLSNFCWTKYEIDDEIVEAKRIQVYTAAEPIAIPDDIAEIEVGYHLDLPGAGEILRLNPRLIVGQRKPFLFLREGNHPLRVSLQKTRPPSWKYTIPEENPKEIPFRSVASSIEYSCPFLLEQETKSCNIPTCIFEASQIQNHFQLFIRPKTIQTPTQPTSSHTTAEVHYQENITTDLDEDSMHLAESLCIKESPPAVSSLHMARDSLGKEPEVYSTRDENEDYVAIGDTGVYQTLEPNLRSNQTHHRQQTDGIHQRQLQQYSGQQPGRNHLLIQKYYSQHFNMTPISAGTFGGLYSPHEPPNWYSESDERGATFINYSTLLSIARKLDTPDPLYHDWRMLAGELGFTAEDIALFEKDKSATCSVITCAFRRSKLTSPEHLKSILTKMNRKDAADCLSD